MGCKFYKGKGFSSAGWDLLWQVNVNVPNLKFLGSPVTKL